MTSPASATSVHVLDDPARASLTGPHAHFAQRLGNIVRYPAEVCPFVSLPRRPDEQDWADVAELVGRGAILPLVGVEGPLPAGWEIVMSGAGVQLVDDVVVRAVAHGIKARGETPFLHAAAENIDAIRLYEALGFRVRRSITFEAARVPDDVTSG